MVEVVFFNHVLDTTGDMQSFIALSDAERYFIASEPGTAMLAQDGSTVYRYMHGTDGIFVRLMRIDGDQMWRLVEKWIDGEWRIG